MEPNDLKTWVGECNWNLATFAEAGMPTISLSKEDGTGTIDQVQLVAGYNMQGCTIWLESGVKLAVWGSAFNDN